nr:hypothetical protein [Candidatus Cloacimonadota bacterium]
MLKLWKISLSLLLLISFIPLWSQSEDAGSTGFDTLKMIYDARTTAMGGAVTGLPQNSHALSFNPAAIMRAETSTISATFSDQFVGSAGGSIEYVYPKNTFVAYGASLRYFNSGSMDRTEVSPSGELIETGDTFGAQSIVASVSAARYISMALDLGASAKFIYDSIDSASASAVLFDIGLLHHTVNENVKVGLSLRNLGFQSSYYTDNEYKENLPTSYNAGLSVRMHPKLITALDIGKADGENIKLRLGAEYQLYPSLALRAGFRSDAGDYHMGSFLGYTGGSSIGLGWNTGNFDLDYALSSYGDLGFINQLTLKYNFAR